MFQDQHVASIALRRAAPRCLRFAGLGLLGLGLLLPSCDGERPEGDGPRTVVLVVLDTVRRDHTQPCGYPKPTTPTLLELARRGTTFCNMVTPGSWTLPTHASIFTGELPTVHGADFDPAGTLFPGSLLTLSGLREDIVTLAELFRNAGWRTALASGNPFLHRTLGLTRGYEVASIATGFREGRYGTVHRRVQRILDRPEIEGRPLFLTINIALAHGPYEAVPAGIPWATETARIDLFEGGTDSIFSRFLRNELPSSQRERLLVDLEAAYDWGVRLADRDLRRCLDALRQRGRLGAETVIAVTSDHGELLGEHGLLDHGRSVVRQNIDVFALVAGPGFEAGGRVDRLVQSQDLFPTLLEAAGLPAPGREHARSLSRTQDERLAITVSQPEPSFAALSGRRVGPERFAAVQRGELRAVWIDPDRLAGERLPGLRGPTEPVAVPPELAELARKYGARAREQVGVPAEIPPELREALAAMGYLEAAP